MPVHTELTTQLEADIDALVHADVAVLADGESIEALHRQLDRLEAVVARATARFSTESGHRLDGAYSAAAWLATRRHLPMSWAQLADPDEAEDRARAEHDSRNFHLSQTLCAPQAWFEAVRSIFNAASSGVRTPRERPCSTWSGPLGS